MAGELWGGESLGLFSDPRDQHGWLCSYSSRLREELREYWDMFGELHGHNRRARDGLLRSGISELLLLHGIAVCGFRSVVLTGIEQERAEPHRYIQRRDDSGPGVRSGGRRSPSADRDGIDLPETRWCGSVMEGVLHDDSGFLRCFQSLLILAGGKLPGYDIFGFQLRKSLCL